MWFDQSEYEIGCEWGLDGLRALLPRSDAVIIVDLLSFSTCVDVAVARGAVVYPYRWADDSAAGFAAEVRAVLAGRRSDSGLSLSPSSLARLQPGSRLVLPSPNGSTLSLSTGEVPTYAACLRNAPAVAAAAAAHGPRCAVIAAGERWPDGELRPALEDWLGAGAVIDQLPGTLSPEAEAARDGFRICREEIGERLRRCVSGRELIARGFDPDLELASRSGVSTCVPRLIQGAYRPDPGPDGGVR